MPVALCLEFYIWGLKFLWMPLRNILRTILNGRILLLSMKRCFIQIGVWSDGPKDSLFGKMFVDSNQNIRLLLCRNSTDPDLCAKNYDKPKQFSPGFFSVGCACNKNITLGYEIMLVWVYTNLCWYHGYYWLKSISMPLFLNLFFHWHLYLVNWLTLTFPKVPESPRNIFRLIECRDINATKLKGV